MTIWNLSSTITYPAETAEALEHHVATDLAGLLIEKGIAADREAVLAALDEHEVHPLIISQCLERTLKIMRESEPSYLTSTLAGALDCRRIAVAILGPKLQPERPGPSLVQAKHVREC
jgi:hypothetical protein